MAYILLTIGVVLVLLSLWEVNNLKNESVKELENLRQMKQEIYQAKSDVEKLILELNKASERAVQDFMKKIDESNLANMQILQSQNEIAISRDELDQLKGQIAMEFSGIEPHQIPERHMLVIQMYDQGLNPAQIAQKIGMGKGEVALILNLHNRSGKNNVQILQ